MKGNRGGKSHNDRKLAARVRTLALKEIEKILIGEDEDYKKAIILKMSTTLLPRLNEHTGEDGGKIEVNLINYANTATTSLHSKEVSSTVSESDGQGTDKSDTSLE